MFKVYSASAGAGKTYNLVLDYLAACFKSHLSGFLKLGDKKEYQCNRCIGYRQILAITFTNNAGSEMKDRVVRQLHAFAFVQTVDDLNADDFNNLSIKVFGKDSTLSAEERFIFLNRTAKALLHDILYDYAQFSITTIDSFIQRVIRSSALYLNLSMSYAVQIRLTDFFRTAIEQYICELSSDSGQFDVVVKELMQQMEDKGKANIRRFLTNNLKILYKDTEKSHPFVKNLSDITVLQKVIDSWRMECKTIENACKAVIKPLCEEALAIFIQAGMDGIAPNGASKWNEWFKTVQEDPFEKSKGFENSKLQKGINPDRIFNKAPKADDLRNSYIQQIIALFEQIKTKVEPFARRYFTCRALSQNANGLLVLSALASHIEEIKTKTDSFFLSESNPLLNDKITSGEGESLFDKFHYYRNLFIDEFQDTSLMQWEDLKPMIINALSEGGNTTLFGDVKQSIYRFRNGDVDLFYRLMDYDRLTSSSSDQDVANLVSKESFKTEPLIINRRSFSSVIQFNNNFFQYYAKDANKEGYYSEVKQGFQAEKTGGLVQIYGYNKKDYKDIRNVWKACSEEFYQNVYLQMKAEEAELLYAVMDAKNRGYEYGEMAVLLRGRAKCNLFAQRLMAAGVPVETSDSLQLCDNPAINLLINALNIVIYPDDCLAETTVLQYFANKVQLSLHQILEKRERESFFEVMASDFQKTDIKEIFNRWKQEPLQVTIKEMVRFFDFQDDQNPFIADFLDLVHEYVQTQVPSIGGFLDWWNDLHLSGDAIPRLSLSGSTGAVRLMTIHSSKGMEFPVVITWCNASTPQPTSYWVKDRTSEQYCYIEHKKDLQFSDFQTEYEEEEEKRQLDVLNLWYVDFTRAKDMLYILTEFPEKSKSEEKDIKNLLKSFANNEYQEAEIIIQKQHDTLFFFGDFDWQKANKEARSTENANKLRITCSEMTFCDNESMTIRSSEEASEAVSTGTHIHHFLQKLTVFPATESEWDALTAEEPAEIRDRLRQLFEKVSKDPTLRPYFYPGNGDQVLNEIPIITKDGSTLRPDRIVVKPDHVMILDYKTGQEHAAQYETQLEEYAQCLREMGFPDVRKDILYIS
jgi:ATP-dependent exoDNAse (exonuclease V) beta subunit